MVLGWLYVRYIWGLIVRKNNQTSFYRVNALEDRFQNIFEKEKGY